MDVTVRAGRAGDGAAMSRVYVEAARAAWGHFLPAGELAEMTVPPEHWEAQMAGGDGARVLVAEADDRVVGFAVVRPSQDGDAEGGRTGELDTLYVEPAAWGRGVGRRLMDRAIARLTEMGFAEATLWTAEENSRARPAYEAMGWRADGERRVRRYLGAELGELRYRISLQAAGGQSA